jgi:hypothetical protein
LECTIVAHETATMKIPSPAGLKIPCLFEYYVIN